MNNKELLYKKLNALRLEVHSSIVDDIVTTVDAIFQEQLLQQTQCKTLLPPDFKCEWVTNDVGCAHEGKKCNVCSKAVQPLEEIKNYYAPYRRQ